MPDARPALSVFQFLSGCGTIAARQDWRTLVLGAQQKTPFDFLAAVPGVLPVRHPLRPSELLEYDEEPEDGCPVIARDVQGGFEMSVSSYDRQVFKVDMVKFGEWLAHRLMKGRAADVAVVNERCVKVLSDPLDVYFLLRSCPADAKRTFQQIDAAGKRALVLMSEPKDLAQSGMAGILQERQRIRAVPACRFVQYSERHREYEYCYLEPFVSFLEHLAQDPPPGTFMGRPPGMGWQNLELVLKVQDKDGNGVADDDVLFARYRDTNGNTVAFNKAIVKDLPKLCGQKRKGVRTSQGLACLKALARGKSAGMPAPSEQKLQTALSYLRRTLCEMFGYFASDDPIPNPAHKATLLRAEFSIRFVDGKSDPILREKALVDISKRPDL
ncbi:MAG: hypothetical protein Q3986_07440 [Akkermansia sp.]|nr:hypothetical protein [Akkermansia sp.]